jgi:hypothetical protein
MPTAAHQCDARPSLCGWPIWVTNTHRRPHVSTDPPVSDAHVNTLRYGPQFPEPLGSVDHRGLGFLTPAVVHGGQATTVREHRPRVLAAASTAHPERFVKGQPQPADVPTAVWINPPAKNTTAQDAPGSTIVTSDDLRVDPIDDADDRPAVLMTDRGATLIASTMVSHGHGPLPSAGSVVVRDGPLLTVRPWGSSMRRRRSFIRPSLTGPK